MYGQLVPVGGGDNVPLVKDKLLVGRRESCDVVLRFKDVSAHHCQLTIVSGYWFVKDLSSTNGTKVNGNKIVGRKRLNPSDELTVAKKHVFTVEYSPSDLGADGPPPSEDEEVFGQGLLDSAGLERRELEDQ